MNSHLKGIKGNVEAGQRSGNDQNGNSNMNHDQYAYSKKEGGHNNIGEGIIGETVHTNSINKKCM